MSAREEHFIGPEGAAARPAAPSADLEERLRRAVEDGLEGNFARVLRFVGAQPEEWIELQSLRAPAGRGTRNRYAHVDSAEAAFTLVRQADAWGAQGVFVIANRVNAAAATRSAPRMWHDAEKGASTSDRDVTHRRVLFVDVDALRTSGTSATDDEIARTIPVARAVFARFAALLGSDTALAYAHSGNGRQVFVAIEPATESPELAAIVKGILAALSFTFVADGVEIDRTVSDAKRLIPAFGTMKRKGAPNVPERPHRRTAFVCADKVVPARVADLDNVLAELFEALSAEQRRDVERAMGRKKDDVARSTTAGSPPSTPSRRFARANALPIDEVVQRLGLVDDERVRCPGCGNTDGVALVNNGLKCHHKRCALLGVPGVPGFRTPVDVVAEARQLRASEAASWLLNEFAVGAPADTTVTADDDGAPSPLALAPASDVPPGFIGRDYPLTDGGNAERFAAHHGADVAHCHDWGKWILWDGAQWGVDRRGGARFRAFQTVRAIPAEVARALNKKRQKALRGHAASSDSASAIRSMLAIASTMPELTILASELDADPWLFNCLNGTIDLRTGALRSHARADKITKTAPCAFDPKADCPKWRAFLSDIMGGNAELVAFLQRAVGYSLSGSVDEQVLFFLHGSGSNGKSTFLRALLELFGDYGLQTAPDLLIAKNNDAHPTATADLFGRRIAVCQEIESGKMFAEATVKQLTGGDILRARRMHEDFWSFRPTHKLFLAANHKPTVRGTDLAIWRRIRLIPFTVTIDGAKKDPELLEKLLAERSGILRWAVDGCLDWRRRGGLDAPKEVVDATSHYRQEQDVVGEFIEDRCDVAPHFTVRSADLLREYRMWCERNGHRELSAKGLANQLLTRGFRNGKGKSDRCWFGLRAHVPGEQNDVRPPDVDRVELDDL